MTTPDIEIVFEDLIARRVVVGTLDTNCWILFAPTGRDAIIVDPGDEPQRIIDACHDLSPIAVTLTHQHWDHVLALPDIAEHYGVDVLAHPDDHEVWLQICEHFAARDRVVVSTSEYRGMSGMTRTRSEYRLSPVVMETPSAELVTRRVRGVDRDVLAALMLDAYRGTTDDEGEDIDDALAAVDHYTAGIEHEHSFVVTEVDRVVAMAFVVVVDGVHYVDPIVVAADRKRTGLGGDAVRRLLSSLATAGVTEVGATITDGNIASERLFLGLGFARRGPWV